MTARWTLGRVQRDLYLTQRGIGDVRAARRGPAPLARRYAHRLVARTVAHALIKAFRTTR